MSDIRKITARNSKDSFCCFKSFEIFTFKILKLPQSTTRQGICTLARKMVSFPHFENIIVLYS